ncbi:MAG: methionine synthase, partial [Bacteroidales bacterium]|nr:methionine synthase [Bacteroidales bacterium]
MQNIEQIIRQRILVLDGAMGSLLQKQHLTEADFRGSCFEDHCCNTQGNFDLLSLSRPDLIEDIHRAYLEAGADIISTNTFNANRFSQAEYGVAEMVRTMNRTSAQLAKKIAIQYSTEEKPRFVAGSVGPTGKSASMSPDIQDPAARSVSFTELSLAYQDQIEGLLEGGADLILLETIFDTLNAKAAIFALHQAFKNIGREVPVMISVTVSDASGRTLSGQTLEAFLVSISHANPLSIGINCSLGAKEMYPLLQEMSRINPFFSSAHPNAGLPDEFGQYKESPESMSVWVSKFLDEQLVNIIGGCCGTTPEHIRRIQQLAEKATPRTLPKIEKSLMVSGLEPVSIREGSNFINIGERCNVAGSLRFARLIREEKFREALEVAREQAENGAGILDINLDDAMLDAKSSMEHFLRLLGSEPEIARLPFMIDASHWEVLENGMQNVQGKPIVNSISLKEGEEKFLERAGIIKQYGAALVVMAFDEQGQASSLERRISICQRAYRLLTEKAGFPPEDIIFDPNVLTICTGMKEHDNYAADFIETVRWIKANLPYARVSGGISNLSFSFRGNNPLREAMHAVFLYHAIQAGLDMAIVNAGALPVYDEIDPELLQRIEDAIFNLRSDATGRLLDIAANIKSQSQGHAAEEKPEEWREHSLTERIHYALIKGNDAFIESDIEEATGIFPSALSIIEGPLMDAMGMVGTRFGEGKMFLPQVVKSARVMKRAVEVLEPKILAEKKRSGNSSENKKILLATVKGDVHDIGKNIVGVVLGCNNYEVIDLGVMVPADKIIETALAEKVDIIGLSGLITPSLDEMIHVVKTLEKRGISIPVIIGGATTSEVH